MASRAARVSTFGNNSGGGVQNNTYVSEFSLANRPSLDFTSGIQAPSRAFGKSDRLSTSSRNGGAVPESANEVQ